VIAHSAVIWVVRRVRTRGAAGRPEGTTARSHLARLPGATCRAAPPAIGVVRHWIGALAAARDLTHPTALPCRADLRGRARVAAYPAVSTIHRRVRVARRPIANRRVSGAVPRGIARDDIAARSVAAREAVPTEPATRDDEHCYDRDTCGGDRVAGHRLPPTCMSAPAPSVGMT